MNLHDIIRRPLLTEKSNIAREEANVVTLAVNPRATKYDIAQKNPHLGVGLSRYKSWRTTMLPWRKV